MVAAEPIGKSHTVKTSAHSPKPSSSFALPICTALIIATGQVFTTPASNAKGLGLWAPHLDQSEETSSVLKKTRNVEKVRQGQKRPLLGGDALMGDL